MTKRDERPVLIAGAGSDIAAALAREMAACGHPLHLAGRRPDALEALAEDLRIRFKVPVEVHGMDIVQTDGLRDQVFAMQPRPHIIVSMVGLMGDQAEQEADPAKAAEVIAANFTGPAALMEAGAALFEDVETPTALVGVSSVAGDRGRARNYYYGAAKAGFTAMLSGLRQRLARTPTSVITVKPGFVATRMTEGMDLPKPLLASDTDCAKMIYRAIRKRREVVYPLKWRLVMTVLRGVPEPIFKKLKF